MQNEPRSVLEAKEVAKDLGEYVLQKKKKIYNLYLKEEEEEKKRIVIIIEEDCRGRFTSLFQTINQLFFSIFSLNP